MNEKMNESNGGKIKGTWQWRKVWVPCTGGELIDDGSDSLIKSEFDFSDCVQPHEYTARQFDMDLRE